MKPNFGSRRRIQDNVSGNEGRKKLIHSMNSIEPLIGTLVLVTTQANKRAKPIDRDVRMTAKMKV
jgi:hypothetical protein